MRAPTRMSWSSIWVPIIPRSAARAPTLRRRFHDRLAHRIADRSHCTGAADAAVAERSRRGLQSRADGEGADEVFGGYDLFKEAKIRRFLSREPDSKIRRGLSGSTPIFNIHPPPGARSLIASSLTEWSI